MINISEVVAIEEHSINFEIVFEVVLFVRASDVLG